MKILHCCLVGPYSDNYGYQENILAKMHKLQNHDVCILASTKTWLNGSEIVDTDQKTYYAYENILVTRLPYIGWMPRFIVDKLRIFKGMQKYLLSMNPDIIFIHGLQFLGIVEILKYVRKYNLTKIYVDNHADFTNSAKNFISNNILHKIIYRYCAKKIEPHTRKFYGTLPIRVDFLEKVYGLPKHKLGLLLMGVDDTLVDLSNRKIICRDIREKYDIPLDSFLIATGGKIDKLKNIHLLVKAINQIDDKNIKLLVFGSLLPDVKNEIENILFHANNIKYIGWQSSTEIYSIFLACDLAFFPGKHSVLWEQAVGLGVPCVFKKIYGHQHVDIGGNCLFIDNVNEQTIEKTLIFLRENNKCYQNMKCMASSEKKNKFSYYEISKFAIEQ